MAVWKQLVASPLIPALTYYARGIQDMQNALVLDVRRCNQSTLEFCGDGLPILSPDDQVGPTNGQLGAFVFINVPCTAITCQYTYSGPGWYHACLARWLLHLDVITWDPITYRIDATAQSPNDCLRRP